MSARITLLLAVFLPLIYTLTTSYDVSPDLPPTAFVAQYYTCTFRVGGLTKPRFSFSRLPSPLTGSRNGNIQGIPTTSGSFRITIKYQQGDISGTKEVLLVVALPNYNTSEIANRNPNKTVIGWSSGNIKTIYQIGDIIDINLAASASNDQYNWTYLHLPTQLEGNSNGRINGVITNEGYYTFAAISADKEGNTYDRFFTINIQPLSYDFSTSYSVPVKNTFQYNAAAIDAVQNDATATFVSKEKLYRQACDARESAKKALDTAVINEAKAKTQVSVVEQLITLASGVVVRQTDWFNTVNGRLKKVNDTFQLRKIAYAQAENVTKDAQHAYNIAAAAFNSSKTSLEDNTNEFIKAQTESSQAASNLSSLQLTLQLATQDVNSTFQTFQNTKEVYQTYSSISIIADFNVSSARNDRDVASFENDAAMAALNGADDNVKKAMQALQNANSSVFQLQQALNEARTALGQAKFNLTQANNNLLVAQAAKEQADKQLLLASAQSIQLAASSDSQFQGCSYGNYPSMFGTTTITAIISKGYRLNSGYTMLYGECTEKSAFSVGDTVSFEGYLRGGYIHALRVVMSG